MTTFRNDNPCTLPRTPRETHNVIIIKYLNDCSTVHTPTVLRLPPASTPQGQPSTSTQYTAYYINKVDVLHVRLTELNAAHQNLPPAIRTLCVKETIQNIHQKTRTKSDNCGSYHGVTPLKRQEHCERKQIVRATCDTDVAITGVTA